jgi:hypothetical protein
MKQEMKYITFISGHSVQFVMFPFTIQHSSMAQDLMLKNSDVLGAGFVNFKSVMVFGKNTAVPDCNGQSISLGVRSREDEDTKVIMKSMFE